MKTSSVWLLALSGTLALSAPAPSSNPAPSVPPTAFQQVAAKLDRGGTIYGFLATDPWLKDLSAKVGEIRSIVLEIPDLGANDRSEIERVFALLENLVRHSGLESLSGLGFSGVEIEPGLYRSRLVLQRDPQAGGPGYFRRWFGGDPHPPAWLAWLPADTAYGFALDLDLAAAWADVGREARQADLPSVSEGMRRLSNQVEQGTGSSLEQHLESLGGQIGAALMLHATRTLSIPLPQGGAVELPEPGFAIALKVRDDRLFRFCEQVFPPPAESAPPAPAGVRLRSLPPSVGVPFPLEFTAAQVDDTFWLTSTPDLLRQLLEVRDGEAPGLEETPEFVRLSHGLPQEGNSWGFVGRRFTQALVKVQQAAFAQAAGETGEGGAQLMQRLFGSARPEASYGLGWLDQEGAQCVSQGTEDPANVVVAAVAIAPTAVLAGMLLPALAKAKNKAQEIQCINNLKQIGLALRIYAVDHNDTLPPDLASVEAELSTSRVLICPMDTAHASQAGLAWSEFDFSQGSYDYLEPGMVEGTKPYNTPVVRCKIHGFVGLADGSVLRTPR